MPGPLTLVSFSIFLGSLHLPVVSDGAATIAERAGLGPAGLACAGLNATQAGQLLDAVWAAEVDRTALQSAQTDMDAAITLIASLNQELELSPGEEQLETELVAAQAALASAKADWENARLQLAVAGGNRQDEGRRARMLGCCKAAASGLPPAFGAVPLTDVQVRDVRLALKAEARAQRLGQAVPDWALATLQQIRSHQDVVNAQAELELHRAEVMALWAQRR